ncbi:MAG TPA: PilZ domain-containing protein [Rhizomicrobium sp.]|jgi:hypothetical protein
MRSLEPIVGNPWLPSQPNACAYEPRPPRKRTYLNGKLVYGEGAYTLDCAIHDISDGGARVILSRRQPLPLCLYLIVVKYCIAYEAQVVWLNFPARGLKFSKMFLLSDALPEELRFLRKLWGDLYTRSGVDTIW